MSVELRALIREVADGNPDANPHEIARLAAELTPDDKVMDYYTETLTALAMQFLGQERASAMNNLPTRSGHANRSHKLKDCRNWWGQLLKTRVAVGDGQWKSLAACTSDDLRVCVEERRKYIAGITEQIENFEYLIGLLAQHGVDTVSDLPPQEDWRNAA